jgi:WD40 repeat protein
MKKLTFLTILFTSVILFSCKEECTNYLEFTDPYFGQVAPESAELFLPEIFPEGEFQGCSGFLDKGKVFVFGSMRKHSDWRLRPVYAMYLKEGRWTKPEVVPFSHYMPYNFTTGPDDQILYFTTLKSPDKTTSMIGEDANIWAVKWEEGHWTEPVMFGESINTKEYYENYPTVTNHGTIFYMSGRKGGVGRTDLYYSKNIDGYYDTAQNVGSPVNTEKSDIDPFVAADESYLIVCQEKEGGFGKFDLYIYFKQENESWFDGINMGEKVNSEGFEARPCVTPDGKYLFFTSSRAMDRTNNTIYWVDAKIIEDLKPK